MHDFWNDPAVMVTGSSVARPPVDRETAKRRARAQLRTAVWEASQFLALRDIEEFVAGCVEEVRADAA